ncbi:MAG: Uma2 family endonuclease [Chloroherpetonaceae bacterium]|nr:Uma2 family endonuclease [Chloroherpetonaceae bacterium]MCS7211880.1 Uma2 family endonuclease [Chloroherpetonaceae bacterium]MDW8466136.1 Uma2 family endonuclease [Chloroherpetonaceae bacterium]
MSEVKQPELTRSQDIITVPLVGSDETLTIDISHIQTEDNAPVDSLFAERQGRLLVDSLYASWKPEQPFLACENVGVFYGLHLPPVVPDVLVSLGVEPPQGEQIHEKRRRSYFVWEYGKAPDVVVEVISATYGGELDEKQRIYERVGVRYYVVYDPMRLHIQGGLSGYELRGGGYVRLEGRQLGQIGLGVGLWRGQFDGVEGEWLRWYDASGKLLLTGKEAAEQERLRAEAAEAQAKQERQRAEQLAAALRKLGIDPEKL